MLGNSTITENTKKAANNTIVIKLIHMIFNISYISKLFVF